jgi:hypothetical protein
VAVNLPIGAHDDDSRLGTGGPDGPQAGYFPFRTGAIISISSVVVFLRVLFRKVRNDELFVSWDRFKLVLCVLIPAIL